MAKIQLEVDQADFAALSRNQRVSFLGGLAADEAEKLCPAPDRRLGSEVWSGQYDVTSIVEAFNNWAASHDGLAPSKRDWSKAGDPDHKWPRAGTVCEVAKKVARERGVRTSRWAPHHDQARETSLLLEAGRILERRDKVVQGLDELEYCEECAHGSGCMPADKSPWQFAVEDMAGLSVRQGSDMNSTPGQRHKHGRDRQMVTGGKADVYPSRSDPAAREAIETIVP